MPLVANHRTSSTTPTAPAPTRRRTRRGAASRSVNSGGVAVSSADGIYFGAAVASAGYTFTSTRRFLA